MNKQQSLALGIGFLVFICLIMPGLTRYLIMCLLLAIIADLTVSHLTYGAVSLLPFHIL